MSRYQKDQGASGQTSKVTAQQDDRSNQPQKGTQQQGKQPAKTQPAQGQGNTKTTANSNQRANNDPAGGKQPGKSQPQGSQKSLPKHQDQQTGHDEKDEYTPQQSARNEAALDPETEKEQQEALKVCFYVFASLTRSYSTLFTFLFC